jgi:phosphopantetheine adenylyltransferase
MFLTSDEIKNDVSYSLEPFKIKEEDLKENVVKNKNRYSEEDL